jgi:hypothetical protein
MAQYPHVRVAGTAEQRGRQYGEQAAARVRRSVSAYREVFAHVAGWDWATVRAEAARFEAPIAAFGPRYLAEMRGLAVGARARPRRADPDRAELGLAAARGRHGRGAGGPAGRGT